MAAPKKVDYAAIEPGWRAGILSPKQLAAQYTKDTGVSVSHTAIIKHFGKLNVPRDLNEKIQAKAEAMVSEAMVTGKVSPETNETTPKDAVIINENATIVANIQLSHRKDIQRSRGLAMKLLDELEQTSDNRELFAQLGLMLAAPDEKGTDKLNDLYMKVISMPQRVDSMKKLSETLKVLIGLEREAFGIDGKKQTAGDALDKFLSELDGRTASLIPG